MYQSAVETSRVFLRDTTVVQPEALLLFGGEISVDHASSTVSVSLGGGLRDDEKTMKKEKKKNLPVLGGSRRFVQAASP